jgi:hypothetical protein
MEYISLKDAMKLTGKSESTFRNLARKLKASNSKNIRLETLKTGHEKILFKLSFINTQFLIAKTVENKNTSVDSGLLKTVEILERQLVAKDELINNLTQLLAMEKQHVQKLLDAPEKKKKKRWFWNRKD